MSFPYQPEANRLERLSNAPDTGLQESSIEQRYSRTPRKCGSRIFLGQQCWSSAGAVGGCEVSDLLERLRSAKLGGKLCGTASCGSVLPECLPKKVQ